MSAQATNPELSAEQRAELLAAAEQLAKSDGPLLDGRDGEVRDLVEKMDSILSR